MLRLLAHTQKKGVYEALMQIFSLVNKAPMQIFSLVNSANNLLKVPLPTKDSFL